jgi:hypothetical protein
VVNAFSRCFARVVIASSPATRCAVALEWVFSFTSMKLMRWQRGRTRRAHTGCQRQRYLKEMDPVMPNGTAACCTAFPPSTSVG